MMANRNFFIMISFYLSMKSYITIHFLFLASLSAFVPFQGLRRSPIFVENDGVVRFDHVRGRMFHPVVLLQIFNRYAVGNTMLLHFYLLFIYSPSEIIGLSFSQSPWFFVPDPSLRHR